MSPFHKAISVLAYRIHAGRKKKDRLMEQPMPFQINLLCTRRPTRGKKKRKKKEKNERRKKQPIRSRAIQHSFPSPKATMDYTEKKKGRERGHPAEATSRLNACSAGSGKKKRGNGGAAGDLDSRNSTVSRFLASPDERKRKGGERKGYRRATQTW